MGQERGEPPTYSKDSSETNPQVVLVLIYESAFVWVQTQLIQGRGIRQSHLTTAEYIVAVMRKIKTHFPMIY